MYSLNSKTYNKLTEELALLAKNGEWQYVRGWFSYWNSEEEKIYKVIMWGKFFLDKYFRDPSPDFHLRIIEKFFSERNEYFAAPRGFSKTTIFQTCICFSIANNLDNFIVLLEKTFNEAAEVIFAIRDEFSTNPAIRQVYGELISKSEAGIYSDKSKDTQGDVMINGVRLRAKGFNQPIRGLKSKEWRPSRILLDDVESDEHISNFEQRQKYLDNFLQGVLPAIDVGCFVKVMGTILHNDSLLMNLITQHSGEIFRAYDKTNPENTLLWPSRWNFERLEDKKQQMMIEGKGSSKFYQEYLNEAVDDANRCFHWEWLQNEYTEEDIKFKALNRYITIDMADSKKDGADFTGVCIVDWDSDNNWYIRYAKRYKINLPELIDLIFKLWLDFKPIKIGVEKKAFEYQVKPFLEIKSRETDIKPIVVQLEDGGNAKGDRIKGALEGRFEAKKIWFFKNSIDDQKILRGELYDFPASKNDDLSDALAYISSLGNRPYSKDKSQPTTISQELEEYRRQQNNNFNSKDILSGVMD